MEALKDIFTTVMNSPYSTKTETGASQAPVEQTAPSSAIVPGMGSSSSSPDQIPYHYTPLAAGQIRMLEILPHNGDNNQPISCTLSTVDIKKEVIPKYEALSYCWKNTDDDVADRTIWCEGQPIAVLPNLHDALMRLRYAHEPRRLWADAVCINQNDIPERASQVAMMREIYSCSLRVIIWLGNEHSGSSAGISLARELAAISQRHKQSSKPLTLDERRADAPKGDDPRCHELLAILGRKWFSRVWMIQEVAVSPDAHILCSPDWIPWAEFVDAILFIAEVGPVVNAPTSSVMNMVFLYNARVHFQKGIRPGLLSLVVQFSRFDATDPKDKIYSLLGLADVPDITRLSLTPDYSEDFKPGALYRNFARRCLAQDGTLEVLSAAQRHLDRVTKLNEILPSWVPDWMAGGSNPVITLQRLEALNARPVVFQTSKGYLYRPKEITSAENGRRLLLEGIVFDTIGTVSSHPSAPMLMVSGKQDESMFRMAQFPIEARRHVAEWRGIAYQSTGQHGTYVNGEPIEDAFWQTLIAGCPPSEKDSIQQEYYAWRDANRLDQLIARMEFDINHPKLFIASRILQAFLPTTPAAAKRFAGRFDFTDGRTMMRTEKGYIGLAPAWALADDRIVILKGGAVPFVLRAAPDGCWQLVGECYVHGIMNGEAFDAKQCTDIVLC
jgi:hypothetical protein